MNYYLLLVWVPPLLSSLYAFILGKIKSLPIDVAANNAWNAGITALGIEFFIWLGYMCLKDILSLIKY